VRVMTENCSPNPEVINPEMKLEDVRNGVNANTCEGHGRSTASGRGYNAERLVNAIFDKSGTAFRGAIDSHIDTYVPGEIGYDIEVKSCVARYQNNTNESGRYGQFRIWKHHHDELLAEVLRVRFNKTGILFCRVFSQIWNRRRSREITRTC